MSLSHHCGGILTHSSLQNCFNSAILEGFLAWTARLRSHHSISIGFKSRLWLGHSKTLILFFFKPFRGGFAGVFRIVVLLHDPRALEFEGTNWWPDVLLQDLLVNSRIHFSVNHSKLSWSWGSKAAPDHHAATTMLYCWHHVLFIKRCAIFMPDVTGCTPSKKFNFWLISPQNVSPKVMRIFKMLFGKCETSLCVLLWQQWFSPGNSPMDAIFGQCLSYSRVVNTDLNWGQLGLQFFGCFSRLFCDLLNELSSHSWSNLSWSTTPGKVCHCSQFSPFVDNGSDSALLEPHSLGDSFETFSKLIEISITFFLISSWISLDRGMMRLFLRFCSLLHFF